MGWRYALLRRSTVPRLAMAFAAGLVGALALAPLSTAALADPDPGVSDTASPSPTDTGQASPTPVDSPTPPTDAPSPTPEQTPPATPATPATMPAGPPNAPAHVLAVTVIAGNAVLDPDYWAGDSGGSFVITVKNTGTVPAYVSLHSTMPAGVTGTATGSCPRGTCTIGSLRPGASRSLTVAIDVDANAWRSAPLTGKVNFSATSPGAAAASGTVTWGILFPPGPPAAGITLQVADVTLDNDITVPGRLVIRLTNTGVRPAAGVIDLVVPAGVSVTQPPGECQQQQQLDPTTFECGLGTVAPGAQQAIAIPLSVSGDARADSPLAGLVRATLTPTGQNPQSTQASYQIVAPQIQSGVSAARSASAEGSPTSRGAAGSGTNHSAAPLIIFGSLLLGLIALVLTRIRRGDPSARRLRWARLLASAPSPRTDTDQPAAATQTAVVDAPAKDASAEVEPTAPDEADTPKESVPPGIGTINLEWTTLSHSAPPPGKPIDVPPRPGK
jgi:hypothetical protein